MASKTLNASRRISTYVSYHFNKVISFHLDSKQVHRLEVERKFLPTPAAVSYLRSNGGGSGFKEYQDLGRQTTQDTYYDRKGFLFSKGVYIRRRNGYWEAKIRSGGNFINSAFKEVDGNDAVKDVIGKHITISSDSFSIEEVLEPCAEFVTERESWMLDGRFKVDIDETDFGHIVGEVELTETLERVSSEHDGKGEKEESRLKEEMDQDIETFMQSYPRAFPPGRPLGKLSAYFDWLGRRK
ncbi:CYTH-like domain-containing protein [Xylogone sp. PMI_703]|nr:CYTH-like domain-containing protein [Xylogone sp. PMI_703]